MGWDNERNFPVSQDGTSLQALYLEWCLTTDPPTLAIDMVIIQSFNMVQTTVNLPTQLATPSTALAGVFSMTPQTMEVHNNLTATSSVGTQLLGLDQSYNDLH